MEESGALVGRRDFGERPETRRRRTTLGPVERRQVLAALYPTGGVEARHWWYRFAVMMALSVVVATLGLSEDSAAVVIGAMLIAPLMTPILAVSAAIVMAWPRRLGSSVLALLAGTAGSVLISYAITYLLPGSDRSLTAEVVARTSPNLRDLLIALAAGAAGAYAVVRPEISAALPGVAVAVALVPPLAATGYTFAIGRSDLAGGALLLFAANVVAILLAGALVLLACGFVPAQRRAAAQHGIRAGLVLVLAATVAVAAPLTFATLRNVNHSQRTQAVNQAVVEWLATEPGLKVDGVTILGANVTVEVAGPQAPPSSAPLLRTLVGLLGPSAAVRVRWFQTSQVAAPTVSKEKTLTLSVVRALVKTWLESASATVAAETRITGLSTSGDSVSVELTGPSAPAPADELATLISKRVGRTIAVSVSWTLATPTPATPTPGSPEALVADAQDVVEGWLTTHPGVQLVGVTSAEGTTTVTLAGRSAVLVTPDLRAALVDKLGASAGLEINFIPARALGA